MVIHIDNPNSEARGKRQKARVKKFLATLYFFT
jgi:hypothetical protein